METGNRLRAEPVADSGAMPGQGLRATLGENETRGAIVGTPHFRRVSLQGPVVRI